MEEKDFVIDEGYLEEYTGKGGDVIIPDGVVGIGHGAFQFCDTLTSVIIPESVSEIGAGAFFNCKNLISVRLPAGITHVGENAFSGCIKLESINMPEGDVYIGGTIFEGCSALRDEEGFIIFGSTLYSYSGDATEVSIPIYNIKSIALKRAMF